MTANFSNRTLWTGDNLDVMRGMNGASVDLIYLDPPFNSNANYAAPIGSEAAGAAFKDTWTLTDVDEAWHGEIADRQPALYAIIDAAALAHGSGMKAYLIMMAVRLMEMHRVLKPTGSIYLHCDPTASHYLKMLMDAVLGRFGFKNEIVWAYAKWSNSSKRFQANHDVILFYSGSESKLFNTQYVVSEDKKRKLQTGFQINRVNGVRQLIIYDTNKARDVPTSRYDRVVDRTEANLGSPMPDVWTDVNLLNSQAKERTGYPTQKPLALLERIIKASSNEGDMVLDPFCGCATTLVAADRLNRQWAGVDLSPLAAKLVLKRIRDDRGPLFDDVTHRTDIPARTDMGKLPNYRTHKHTLYGQQEGRCAGCRVLFPFRNMTVDHIVPRAKGGQDNFENLQLLCAACNSTKGAQTQERLITILKRDGIR